MKYIITESQYKLISELERDWRSRDYEEKYNKLKHKFVPYFVNLVEIRFYYEIQLYYSYRKTHRTIAL